MSLMGVFRGKAVELKTFITPCASTPPGSHDGLSRADGSRDGPPWNCAMRARQSGTSRSRVPWTFVWQYLPVGLRIPRNDQADELARFHGTVCNVISTKSCRLPGCRKIPKGRQRLWVGVSRRLCSELFAIMSPLETEGAKPYWPFRVNESFSRI
jgi:hypothetical protein